MNLKEIVLQKFIEANGIEIRPMQGKGNIEYKGGPFAEKISELELKDSPEFRGFTDGYLKNPQKQRKSGGIMREIVGSLGSLIEYAPENLEEAASAVEIRTKAKELVDTLDASTEEGRYTSQYRLGQIARE